MVADSTRSVGSGVSWAVGDEPTAGEGVLVVAWGPEQAASSISARTTARRFVFAR
jgi:hypothetical protein